MKKLHPIPNLQLPTLSINDLESLHTICKEFNIEHIRLTPGNQLSLSNLDEADNQALIKKLSTVMKPMPTNGITSIHTCADCTTCDNTTLDTSQITAQLENLILPTPMPAKIKVAVAGCKRCCTMPLVRDIGLTPIGKRWRLSFGGNGGRNPRIADIIAEGLNEIEAIDLTRRCLVVYQKHADRNMRTSAFIDKFGLITFKDKIFPKKESS
ncbi:MAG: hypothetical protein HKP41_20245 [Desulfobacterales bacterium]|nr:hypothetical protein [Desulfobacterales bacterium]